MNSQTGNKNKTTRRAGKRPLERDVSFLFTVWLIIGIPYWAYPVTYILTQGSTDT